MPLSLAIVTPPADPPVTVAEAKEHLRVPAAFGEADAYIGRLLRAAAADATSQTGIGVGVGTYKLTLDDFPRWWAGRRESHYGSCDPIELPVRPAVSVAAVRYYDAAGAMRTLAGSAYFVGQQSGRLVPLVAWPAVQTGRPDAVEVEFTAGLVPAAVPEQAKQAVLLIVGHAWARRGDDLSGSPADPADMPPAARRLLFQCWPGDRL